MSNPQRETVRRYLLGTLDKAEHDRIQTLIERDEEIAELVEAEREALRVLDRLPVEAPPNNLSRSVLDRIDLDTKPGRTFKFRLAALVSLVAVVLIGAAIIVPTLRFMREKARDTMTSNNLKQIGLSLKMYAGESRGGKYPPVTPYDGVWMVDLSLLYPDYLGDLTVLVAPRLPDYKERLEEMRTLQQQRLVDWERVTRIAARGYSYFGWLVNEPEEIVRLAQERTRLAKAEYDLDLQRDGVTIFRLREGVERFMITDINNAGASAQAQSTVVVMFEVPNETEWNAGQSRSHTLYMDGHVERLDQQSSLFSLEGLLDILSPPER